MKQWACPACTAPVSADTLQGVQAAAEGQWLVRGECPRCGRGLVVTKHGAAAGTRSEIEARLDELGQPWPWGRALSLEIDAALLDEEDEAP